MKLAPIVLFVYNRPEHTRRTIEALQQNTLAGESQLIIYSDAAKDAEAETSVQQVRDYIATIDGFKSVQIKQQKENQGLAKSITEGVTEVVNKYGKVIVMEDDLVTSRHFLQFMNDALEFYKDDKRIWHISGWNYPISPKGIPDIFAWRVMNCWGWATWTDRWQYFEKDTDKLYREFSWWDRFQFDFYGVEGFWKQVRLNKHRVLNTWAIFWYANIFKHSGWCINPTTSLTENIGYDTGTHFRNNFVYTVAAASSAPSVSGVSFTSMRIMVRIWLLIFHRRVKALVRRLVPAL